MYYYEVAPSSRSYKNDSLLTYHSSSEIERGQIVIVKIRSKIHNAFIVKKVPKPQFPTIRIEEIIKDYRLPNYQVEFFLKLNEYYPGSLGSTASMFVPYISKKLTLDEKTYTKNVDKNSTKKLTPNQEQQTIINSIIKSNNKTHILHADTGTGKTLIYAKISSAIIQSKQSVIVMTPEISLTPQLAEQFYSLFKNVYIIHSKMTENQRSNVWAKIRNSKEPVIVIGPRSALFAPVNNLGSIIIDEFHDTAYKQDQAPKFQTVRIAAILSKITDSKLILGSATPPIEDYFYATQKGAEVHRLTKLPKDSGNQKIIKVVQLSNPKEITKYDLLSTSLISLIKQTLDNSEQVMLFLNKRGTSRVVLCQNCGYSAVCSRCNIPYIYHHDSHSLVCHTCYKKIAMPISCPDCGSDQLIYKNPGTKQIELIINKLFPSYKIGRYDKDNKKTETFYANQADIAGGKIDILIGTQLLTKGHDLPKLGLVGVLNSDSGLQFPDYSSSEKNFQTLYQIIGRVGRGHIDGNVLVQTFSTPDKYANLIEQKKDTWVNFYRSEIKERERFNYPPFSFMLKIELSRSSEQVLIKNIEQLANNIHSSFTGIEVIGPAPSLLTKRNNKYYWQIIIKSKQRSILTKIISILPKNCSYDLDPINLL